MVSEEKCVRCVPHQSFVSIRRPPGDCSLKSLSYEKDSRWERIANLLGNSSNSLPNCILPGNPIDNLHPLHPIRISLDIALIPWKTEHKVGLLGRIVRPLRNMRHYTSQIRTVQINPQRLIDSPPCQFGSKSVTNEVHIRAAICPSSSLAGSDPRGVIFCTGFAKTKGI